MNTYFKKPKLATYLELAPMALIINRDGLCLRSLPGNYL